MVFCVTVYCLSSAAATHHGSRGVCVLYTVWRGWCWLHPPRASINPVCSPRCANSVGPGQQDSAGAATSGSHAAASQCGCGGAIVRKLGGAHATGLRGSWRRACGQNHGELHHKDSRCSRGGCGLVDQSTHAWRAGAGRQAAVREGGVVTASPESTTQLASFGDIARGA